MMAFKDIVHIVFAETFRPYRICSTGGKVYDIRHPEAVYVGNSSLTISTFFLEGEDNGQHWKNIPLKLIESIEPLDISAGNN